VSAGAVLWHVRGASNFADRDDGIITLAQARMFVEHGSVAVSRFGGRVSGFSAPLHFLVAVLYYWGGGSSYQLVSRLIGFGTLAAIGALSGLVVADSTDGLSSRLRWAAVVAVGVLQLSSWSFFGWQMSGMENGLTSVLLLGVVAVGPSTRRSLRWSVVAGVLLALLGLSRFDAVTICIPLVLVLLHGQRSLPTRTRLRFAAGLLVPPAVVAVVTAAALQLYFGGIRPTTVDNRGRDLLALAGLLLGALAIAGVLAWLVRSVAASARRVDTTDGSWSTEGRRLLRGPIPVGVVIVVGAIMVGIAAVGRDAPLGAYYVAYATGVVWTGLLVALAFCWKPVAPPRLGLYAVVLLWVPLYEFVFGPTRLAMARVVSSAVPVLSLATVLILVRCWAAVRGDAAEGTPRWVKAVASIAVVAMAVTMLTDAAGRQPDTQLSYAGRFDLCCSFGRKPSLILRHATDVVATVDPHIVPIVANPDLGELAHAGVADIVDIGLIGDPVYLAIHNLANTDERAALSRLYLTTVYPPDVIEAGSQWACDLRDITESPGFSARYRRVVDPAVVQVEGSDSVECWDGRAAPAGMWELRHPAGQTDLELAARLIDGRATADAAFFEPCRVQQLDDCLARMRAFQRAFPGADHVDEAMRATAGLGATAQGRLVRALLQAPTRPEWATEAFAALREVERQQRVGR
jgi:hypothetical protein